MILIYQKIIFNVKSGNKLIYGAKLSITCIFGMKNDIDKDNYDNNNKFYMLGINEDVE